MKRLIITLGCLMASIPAHAVHNLIFKDASDLTSGSLDPNRVDKSTFTMRGTQWSVDVDASTSALARRITQTNIITVGTSSVRGANIVGSDTRVFDFAISSIGSAGTIYVQKGDYFLVHGVTVPERVEIVFEASACVKNDSSLANETFFFTSGTITNLQLDYTGDMLAPTPPAISMMGRGKLNSPRFNVRINNYSAGGLPRGFVYFGPTAKNAVIDSPFISSWTAIVDNNIKDFFLVDGASNSAILNPIFNGQHTVENSQSTAFKIFGCDGFLISGGIVNVSGKAIWIDPNTSTKLLRGVIFTNTLINSDVAWSGGLIDLQGQSNDINFTTGTVISNLHIRTAVATGVTVFSVSGGGEQCYGPIFLNNDVVLRPGSSVSAFTIGAGSRNAVIMGNSVSGTSAFITDNGVGTKSTGNDNWLNGVEN